MPDAPAAAPSKRAGGGHVPGMQRSHGALTCAVSVGLPSEQRGRRRRSGAPWGTARLAAVSAVPTAARLCGASSPAFLPLLGFHSCCSCRQAGSLPGCPTVDAKHITRRSHLLCPACTRRAAAFHRVLPCPASALGPRRSAEPHRLPPRSQKQIARWETRGWKAANKQQHRMSGVRGKRETRARAGVACVFVRGSGSAGRRPRRRRPGRQCSGPAARHSAPLLRKVFQRASETAGPAPNEGG